MFSRSSQAVLYSALPLLGSRGRWQEGRTRAVGSWGSRSWEVCGMGGEKLIGALCECPCAYVCGWVCACITFFSWRLSASLF